MSLIHQRLHRGLLSLLLPLIPWAASGMNEWPLASPDQSREIILRLDSEGRLSYQVKRADQLVMKNSPLGLVVGNQKFINGLRCVRAGALTPVRERYELFAGIVPKVDCVLHHRSVEFQNTGRSSLIVDLAASDQGVAFRYRLKSDSDGIHEVSWERTGFRLPVSASGWLQPYHAAGKYTPAYEDFYFNVSPGELPPHSREKPIGWAFPALFEVPSADSWLLLTETSGLDPYPACHLAPQSADGVYRIAFPRHNEQAAEAGDERPDLPHHKLPWTMPWRVIIVAENAAEIATSTLVTDLAPPSQLADTSWIKPGRASWAWWSYPEGPFTLEAFNSFTHLAADMGWEYTLFDANWWDPGIVPLIEHATSRNVASMMWTHAHDYNTPQRRKNKLDEVAGYGAVGLKADFWCSDKQETIETIKALFKEAAARKLLVNLHGCTLPRGWHRTWPNFITAEAVLGAESYLYESQFSHKAAELNTVLPFTRNVAGPMDYTPVALSPKRYSRTTTAAHELATAIIFTSGIIHYAEGPELLEKLPPEATRILRDAPARWDETRCLVGEPGQMVVIARRSGASWLVAGISASSNPRTITLDLTELGNQLRQVLIHEGGDAHYSVVAETPAHAKPWQHTIPPRGGFILRLDP